MPINSFKLTKIIIFRFSMLVIVTFNIELNQLYLIFDTFYKKDTIVIPFYHE